MRAIGFTCGVGSMLIGARSAGFNVVGNVEWRKYYHCRDDTGRNTFEENFKGAFLAKSLEELSKDQIQDLMGIDLAMGHPECGNFSGLNSTGSKALVNDAADIPLFVQMVQTIKPRFFVMDNLPKSLIGYPMERWLESLQEYDLFPEWISNYNYGNVQKWRNRFFMIGARRSERFLFVPGEFSNRKELIDVVKDLPVDRDLPEINHVHRRPEEILPEWKHYYISPNGEDRHVTVGEFIEYLRDVPCGMIPYLNVKDRKWSPRIGRCKIRLHHPAQTVSGGGWQGGDNHFREDTLQPLTIREKARIQGAPDDFVFYPLDKNGTFLTKQVGKFMPVQFCEYVSRQIAAHTKGAKFESSGERIIPNNQLITEAKRQYCRTAGHSDREGACRACWMSPKACGVVSPSGLVLPPIQS